jgi:hypothetical protein
MLMSLRCPESEGYCLLQPLELTQRAVDRRDAIGFRPFKPRLRARRRDPPRAFLYGWHERIRRSGASRSDRLRAGLYCNKHRSWEERETLALRAFQPGPLPCILVSVERRTRCVDFVLGCVALRARRSGHLCRTNPPFPASLQTGACAPMHGFQCFMVECFRGGGFAGSKPLNAALSWIPWVFRSDSVM